MKGNDSGLGMDFVTGETNIKFYALSNLTADWYHKTYTILSLMKWDTAYQISNASFAAMGYSRN